MGLRRSWYNYRNLIFLLLLYFVQGIPYGLQARFLPIFLRSKGTSLASLGLIKLLLLPWLLKILWAPLFDWMQSKRKWLLASMFGLFCVCSLGSCISLDNILFLCAILFLLNVFSSTQDIAVDGFAMQLLTHKQVGMGNTIQVVGYKFGSIFGGGVLMWLSMYLSLNGLFLFLSFIYLFSISCIFQFDVDEKKILEITENDGCTVTESGQIMNSKRNTKEFKQLNKLTEKENNSCLKNKKEAFVWLKKLIQLPGTLSIIILVIVYKLGEQGCVDQFPLYLVDRGTPASTVGFWSGVVCQAMSIAGSILGGIYLSRFRVSPLSFLQVLFYVRLVPMIIEFCHTLQIIQSDFVALTAMTVAQLIGGAITTTMFTLMMQCSQRAPGTLKGFDQTVNLILDESHERVFSAGEGVEQVLLGLYIIRGDNIAVIGEIDDETDSSMDMSDIRAEPLNPVVH
ncbi:major facilitator superfamily domain-containing protein 3-like [Antedon mediterranea]|uniref:major facilitator superfamily domain-containing protein 3-like n=1 Tax=Antedon mediterranea TaxID=105859 RepID=UPI003AF7AC42